MPHTQPRKQARFVSPEWEDEEEPGPAKDALKEYWKSLANKYHGQTYDATKLSGSPAKSLPPNWFVVSISVSEDKNTMFVTRQCVSKEPLVFYIPLKERREMDDEEYLSFDNAVAELRDIIQLSDEGTRGAVNVRNDRDARAAWWANRSALDKRMKQLLENIEFCWLGAFKVRSYALYSVKLSLN
jgi:separase